MKLSTQERVVLNEAAAIYERLAKDQKEELNSAELAMNLFKARLVGEEREHFEVCFLDQQNKIILTERMFSGTINQSSVYPREIAKKALSINASNLILAHNHPSGAVSPSVADINLTKLLKDALSIFEVNILDHIIVGFSGKCHSMAQHNEV